MQRAFPRAANKTVFGIALFIGCIVAGTGEIVQIFVVSRYPDITDILLGACGAGVGSLLPCAVRSKTVSWNTMQPYRSWKLKAQRWKLEDEGKCNGHRGTSLNTQITQSSRWQPASFAIFSPLFYCVAHRSKCQDVCWVCWGGKPEGSRLHSWQKLFFWDFQTRICALTAWRETRINTVWISHLS